VKHPAHQRFHKITGGDVKHDHRPRHSRTPIDTEKNHKDKKITGNPAAAGVAKIPEESSHTSVKAGVDHCREAGGIPCE